MLVQVAGLEKHIIANGGAQAGLVAAANPPPTIPTNKPPI
jgi:hypothetical protein